jgi:hypothetical protein
MIALDMWGPMSTANIGVNIWFLGVVYYDTLMIIGNLMTNRYDSTITKCSMISVVMSTSHIIFRVRIVT